MTKPTLKDFMECINYSVSEGSEYCWSCYGNNAMSLDHWNNKVDNEGVCISVVFDTVTQTVYEMQAWDYSNNREYRWICPEYVDAYRAEAARRGIDSSESLDGKKFIDLDVVEDFFEKARAIFLGEKYDTRVILKLSMTEEEELQMMRAAHAQDITLNDYIQRILRETIDKHE